MASWIVNRNAQVAGRSAWSNREILAEVIERVPTAVRAAGARSRLPLVRRLPWPSLSRPGRALRSWYLFDFFATEPSLARGLMRHVASQNERLEHRGVDFFGGRR